MSNEIVLVKNRITEGALRHLRDDRTNTRDFRAHSNIITEQITSQAILTLPTHQVRVITPLEATIVAEPEDSAVASIMILRAGLAFQMALMNHLPDSEMGFIGLERDEETAEAKIYYDGLTELKGMIVLICDPMLATGGSMNDTIKLAREAGAREIRALAVIAAPEGISAVQKKNPDVTIYVASVDTSLNSDKYIVPGLGDYGDRQNGVKRKNRKLIPMTRA